MTIQTAAPWHKTSFDAFLKEGLPRLLGERVPLASYYSESTSPHSCRIRILLATKAGEFALDLSEIPQPDAEGIFEVNSQHYVVLPLASSETLDQAQIQCVGEQLYEFIDSRLGEAPDDLAWDENLVRAWLPIDAWIGEFLQAAQLLDDQNWLARITHLRRIRIPDRQDLFNPTQVGRVCPVETPEGTNIGHILSVATGAEIRDGRLVVVDPSSNRALGVTASMVPFLEHNDPNRQLMGVNMMRQWIPADDPEPALVQTGNEPADPRFWCGRNLLTAFVCWGIDSHEDGIIVSASAAARMNQGRPLEPGDKLSNRHGTKGVIARIVPDEQMLHLSDGTPVELIFNWIGIHARVNFGQVREAIMGRIARLEGKPAIVPPFAAPSAEQIRERLGRAGLCPTGMERLRSGANGPELERSSTVGWVYWGKTLHIAVDKVTATVDAHHGMLQTEPEYLGLRDIGAYETIREQFNTRSAQRADVDALAGRVAAGPIEQAPPPSPTFADVVCRLAAADLDLRLGADHLTVRFRDGHPDSLSLAQAVAHPWAEGRQLTWIGTMSKSPEYAAVVQANDRLRRLQTQGVPPPMLDRAVGQLQDRVRAFFDSLLTPEHLRLRAHEAFSGKAVLSPGPEVHPDQVGLAEEIAWTLFGPLVSRKIGASAVASRSAEAVAVLDETMANSWVIIHRAPTIMPTSFLAFHPVRIPDRVIRLHPLSLMLMNADFDGDQAAVFLPVTQEGQREAGQKLTIAAHLARDPGLVRWLCPPHASMWGLADLSLREPGRQEIARIAGMPVETPQGFVSRVSMEKALRTILQREGAERMLQVADQLLRLGFDHADRSGASIGPFIGASLELPAAPAGDDSDAWNAYADEIASRIGSYSDFASDDLGPQAMAVRCGARVSVRHMVVLLGARGALAGFDGQPFILRHGWVHGCTPEEYFVASMHARRALGQVVLETTRAAYNVKESAWGQGLGLLARAMRSAKPGVVFARAAVAGEVDPLTDLDSRLFVGLPVVPSP